MDPLTSILSSYVPTETRDERYTITMPLGEEIHCRRLVRYKDLAEFDQGIREFWERCQSGGVVPAAREFAPQNFDEAKAAYTLMFHTVEPTKFDEVSACKLLLAPLAVQHLVTQIQTQQYADVMNARLEVIEAGKADTPETPTSGIEPSNPSASTESTPAT